MKLSLIMVFCLLVLSFSVTVITIFTKKHVKFLPLRVLASVLLLLGGLLIFLTLGQGVSGVLKLFLLLAGAAPVAMVVSAILHNIVCALFSALLKREFEEPIFFLIAMFGCPAVFLIGAVGSITLIIRGLVAGQYHF